MTQEDGSQTVVEIQLENKSSANDISRDWREVMNNSRCTQEAGNDPTNGGGAQEEI